MKAKGHRIKSFMSLGLLWRVMLSCGNHGNFSVVKLSSQVTLYFVRQTPFGAHFSANLFAGIFRQGFFLDKKIQVSAPGSKTGKGYAS